MAGGLLADRATLTCLARLNFKKHAELAKEHDGDKNWRYRHVQCADVELEGQDFNEKARATNGASHGPTKRSTNLPSELDWLFDESVKSYEESGSPSHSAQVNPYMFTKTLAALAVESGANIVIGSATAINYGDDGKAIKSVQYLDSGTWKTLVATDVLINLAVRYAKSTSVTIKGAGTSI